MKVAFKTLYLKKLYPLRISRGVRDGQSNLYVSVTDGGHTGWGETSPGASEGASTPEEAQTQLENFLQHWDGLNSVHDTYDAALKAEVTPCALAALDIALWDLMAKKAGMPLYTLLGFSLPKHPTSMTLGIMQPEEAKERLPLILKNQGINTLKVKLGSNDGIEADKAMYHEVLKYHKENPISIRVDANGG